MLYSRSRDQCQYCSERGASAVESGRQADGSSDSRDSMLMQSCGKNDVLM